MWYFLVVFRVYFWSGVKGVSVVVWIGVRGNRRVVGGMLGILLVLRFP